MLACLTCSCVLEEEGIPYAVTRQSWYLRRPGRVDTRRLRTSHSLLFRFCLSLGIIYPKHFYNSVTRLGYALQALVGREHLCRLAQNQSLKMWIASLPTELQAPTSYILGTCEQKPALEDAIARHRFGLALAAIGNQEGAIAEVQESIRLQPNQARFYQTLGFAYYDWEHLDEAISTWRIAAYLDEADADASFNAAGALAFQGEVESAVAWFREAARRQPKRAIYQYYLGRALTETRDWAGARTAWEKVLTLDDEKHAEVARQALQENPLSPTADAGRHDP